MTSYVNNASLFLRPCFVPILTPTPTPAISLCCRCCCVSFPSLVPDTPVRAVVVVVVPAAALAADVFVKCL